MIAPILQIKENEDAQRNELDQHFCPPIPNLWPPSLLPSPHAYRHPLLTSISAMSPSLLHLSAIHF